MIETRKSIERGHANHGWLKSFHTFSFADFYDPKKMNFGVLRVINEDFVEGGQGFATHGHRNMEIVTYVVSGAVAHKDSMGNETTIRKGEIQRMSAGTGVRHSEFNPNQNEVLHLLQIWIEPEKSGTAPGYEQKDFSKELSDSSLVKLVSPLGENGTIRIGQDVSIFAAKNKKALRTKLESPRPRRYWVQLIGGVLKVSHQELSPGDGVGFVSAQELDFDASENSEFLVFELPL